ncbi:Protein of unknown function [Sphingomonas guangdongensis]|uniref:UPF0311 protein SAMN06297144_3367 n=1 Tax=Sphingomonas guangdongensis TaxID=1141890 RepID=A0A285R766_9SPHN|nr:DUF3237 domain-containing protein [Sphingomonas guangdongensis]SOB88222.1 Protein of unknown function [Sphingomonas guangdongensis]
MLTSGPLLVAVAAAAQVAPPRLAHAFTVSVDVGAPQEQGRVDGKRMRFVPITGGRVSGPRLTGTVLAGGGDWQALHDDGLTEVRARYSIRADDGTIIDVVNEGVRTATPEVAAELARGAQVDPSRYYFRSNPRFTAPTGAHGWLRRTHFVAVGIRRPANVEIQVFAVE